MAGHIPLRIKIEMRCSTKGNPIEDLDYILSRLELIEDKITSVRGEATEDILRWIRHIRGVINGN